MQVACIYLRVSTEEQDLTRQEGIEQSARAACYYIAGIYREKASGFLAKGPVRSVRIPAHLRETDKTTMTWDQLRAALSKLGLRDRILLEFDMSNALRPGELFGLRWKCFDPAVPSITIMETTYKGKIRPWGKTRGSLTTTPIATELAAELVEWTKLSKDPSPEAFIFPNRVGGFLDSSNFRNRVLHKLAEELELPKLTFQVIRRSIATMAQRKGTVKDVQGILRHSRTATTTDVYMQELPEGVRATVNSIHKELKTGTGGSGAVATSRSTQSTAKPASAGPESETRVVEMPVTRNELKSGKLTRHFRKERWEELKTFLDEGFEICCQLAAKHQGTTGFEPATSSVSRCAAICK